MSIAPFPAVPEGFIWQYDATNRAGRITHQWSLKNDNGGTHVHAWLSEFGGQVEWMGGIECHWAKAPESYGGWFSEKPSQEHCWLLHGPCWHDGSSLYFSERIAPMLPAAWEAEPNAMKAHHHAYVMGDLISWHRDKIEAETTGDAP